MPVPKVCPKCQAEYVYFVGEGAERVEECLRERFPLARIARLDRDTVHGKRRYHSILSTFAQGKLDILVGTQMVAKGHDFQRVTLVGVVSADLILGLPDFRAAERTFQILTQVAGRAGRGDLPGKVLVQTYFPDHYAVKFGAAQDYYGFYEKESEFRRLMHYPPYVALASILVRSRQLEEASKIAQRLGEFLEKFGQNGLKVLGPATAPIARLRSDYRFQFLLKASHRKTLSQALHRMLSFCQAAEIPSDRVLIDVDPLSLM
jgi:primosomal protein N' (replication factor Y)